MGKLAVSLVLPLTAQPNCRILHPLISPEGVDVVDRQVRDSASVELKSFNVCSMDMAEAGG